MSDTVLYNDDWSKFFSEQGMHTRCSCAVVFALRVMMAASIVLGASAHAAIQEASDGSTYIHVDDPRPLAEAATELSRRYSHGISYEDPAYRFSDDLQDVTQSVSKQSSANSVLQRRILVPAGGTLDARLSEGPVEGREAVAAGIRKVLEVQASGASGGRFRLEEGQGMFHIVPTQVRATNGDWMPQSSLLSRPISIPAGAHTGAEMLHIIAAEVSRATGQTVELGVMPLNAFRSVRQFPAKSASARDILVDLLTQGGRQLTWRLLYAPDLQRYYLSIVSYAGTNESTGVVREDANPPPSTRPNEGVVGDTTKAR